MPRLTQDQITARLTALPGWGVHEGFLKKTYKLRSFAHGVLFIGTIGQLAEAANHHPDVCLHDYSQVSLQLVTHSEGGLTEKDFDLADQLEALPHKPPK